MTKPIQQPDKTEGRTYAQWIVPVLSSVLVLTAIAVIYVTALLLDSNQHQAQVQFDNQTTSIIKATESRVALYTGLLRGIQTTYAVKQTPITRDQYHRIFQGIDLRHDYPGISGVSFTQHLNPGGQEEYVRAVQHDASITPGGYPNFTIRPAGFRPDPYVITYSEPFNPTAATFGLDISTDPGRYEAIQRARDTGQLESTGLVTIYGTNTRSSTKGFVVFAPLYESSQSPGTVSERRSKIVGVLNAVFRANNLFQGIVQQSGASQDIQLSVIDGAAPSGHQILYGSDSHHGSTDDFRKTSKLNFGGKTWTLVMTAPQSVGLSQFDQLAPIAVLLIGLVICLLLASMVAVLFRSRSRAIGIADTITKELRESEAQYRQITSNSQELINLLTPEGVITFTSPASQSMLAYKSTEIVGRSIMDLVIKEDSTLVADALARIANANTQNLKLEYRLRTHTHTTVWVEALWQSIDLRGKTVIQISSRDISERKKVEDNLRRQTDELERLNQAMVGRELKMIELKRRMKEEGNNA